jgi:hypothetical protein
MQLLKAAYFNPFLFLYIEIVAVTKKNARSNALITKNIT